MQQNLADRTPFFYGWLVLAAAGTANFARNAAASLTISVFIYPLSEELGWSRTLIAGAAAAGGLAATFTSPIIGRLIDRYGARTVLTASIIILIISTAALAWSDISLTIMGVTIPWVFYIAYATGRVIFASPVQIGTSVVVSRWFIRMRGRTNGILGLTHSAGMVLFPLIASIVIAQSGWRDAWYVLSVVVFVVALFPVALLISETPEDLGLRPDGDQEEESTETDQPNGPKPTTEEEPNWTSSAAIRTPALWLLALATGMLFFMHAGSNTHAAAFFQDQGLGTVTAGVSISLNAIFLGISSLFWGRIVERIPARYVMAAVALNLAIGAFLFTFTDTAVEALAFSAFFGFGLGGMLVVPPVAYADYYGRASLGTIRGITEPFTTLGQAIGVIIPGLIFDFIGNETYLPFFYLATAIGLLATVASLFATKPEKRPSPPETVAGE